MGLDQDLLYPEEDIQKKALEIYLSTASQDNNFKPLSYVKIAEQLSDHGFQTSKSSIDRWSKCFNFKKHLDHKIELAYISSNVPEIQRTVKTRSTQDIADRFKVNGELTDDLYVIARCFVDDAKLDLASGNRIDKDRMKIIKDLLVLTTNREDKLLDRLANTGGDKLTSKELLAELNEIEVEVEIDE